MAIVNFYEKYDISQSDELEQIQWIINQKIIDEKNDSFSDGHSDRMFFLESAKEAFATAESKAKYDKELADSQKKSDPDGERKVSFDKWYTDAQKYQSNQQWDLAKTAIDRAMQFATPDTADSAFYDTAAWIYFSLKQHSQALDLENQSIVLSPEEANGYYLKSVILFYYIFEKNLGNDKMQDIWQQLKSNCDLTIKKVIAQERGYIQASKCYEFLAEMHYVYANKSQYPITGNNNALAEDYALKAIAIINAPNPDVCPVAKKILDDIAARRAKVAELEQANTNLKSKLKMDNDALERQNLNLRSTVSSQKTSINNATTYGSTKFGGEAGFGAITGIVGLIALNFGGGSFGMLCIIVAIATFAIKGVIIAKNNNIRDTLASIRENESKISSNDHQINSNKSDIDSQVRNNDNIIAQQSDGLAPRPSTIFSDSTREVEFETGFIAHTPKEGEAFPDTQPFPPEDCKETMYVPVVLTTTKTISEVQDVLPLLETIVQQGKELVIVAEDVVGEALATLYVNKLRATFNSIPIKADNSIIQRISELTGSQVITGDLKSVTINQLGLAREVTITSQKTVVVPW